MAAKKKKAKGKRQATEEAKKVRITLLYLGQDVRGSEHKLCDIWYRLGKLAVPAEKAEYDGERVLVYHAKRRHSYAVGGVYHVDAVDEGGSSIYRDTFRYQRMWDVEEDVAVWQGIHRARTRERELAEREKKGKAHSQVKEVCEPLRTTYRNLIGRQRMLFLAEVVSYITGGR